jgi:hypothetical protein|tara:strand:+ start:59 stop:199 length:141 start_codon:yes stop_codon:yes gene_type:complete
MATFTKKVVKSGRGYMLWIPKDVVELMSIKNEAIVEVKLKKLKKEK